MGLLE
jgi:hypothetical protein